MGKKREEKNIIKNQDRPYRFWTKTKKIFAGIIVAVIVAGVAIGLAVGLTGNTNNPTPPGPSIEQPDNPGGSEIVTPPGGNENENPGGEVKPDPGPGEGEIKPDPGPEEPEIPPVEENKIENVGDLIANHGSTVYNLFANKFQEGIGKKVFGKYFDKENLISVEWDLGGDDVINEIKFIATYKTSETATTFAVGKIDIADFDINGKTIKQIEDYIKDSTPTFTKEYTYGYMDSTLNQNIELKNAICDKLFGEDSSAERYIVDLGHKIDNSGLSDVRSFKVVQITKNGLQEKTVWIKDDGKDYKVNFEKGDYIEINEGVMINFSGNKLEKTDQSKLTLADVVLEMPDGNYFELI